MIDGRNWLPIQEKRVEAALTHFTIKVDVFAFGFIANMILLKFEARLRKLFNKMKVLDWLIGLCIKKTIAPLNLA